MYIRDNRIHARQDAPSSDADSYMSGSDAGPHISSNDMPDPTSPASTTSIARVTAQAAASQSLSRKQFAEDSPSSADAAEPWEPTSSSTPEDTTSSSSRRPRPTSSAPQTPSPVPTPPSEPSDISTQPPSSIDYGTPSDTPTSSEPPYSSPPQSSEQPAPPASSVSALPTTPPSAAPTAEPTPSPAQASSLTFAPVLTSLPATDSWSPSTALSSFTRSSVTLIALATTVKGPSTTYTSVTYGALATKTAEQSGHQQLKGGAIAGIVIGVLAGLVIIGAIVFGLLRRRRDERSGADDYDFYGGDEKGANLKRSGTTHSALDFSDGPVSPHASWGPAARAAPAEPAWHGGAFLNVPGSGAGYGSVSGGGGTYGSVAGMSGPLSNIAAGGIGAGGLTAVGTSGVAGAVTTRSPAHSPTPTRGFEHDDPSELHTREPLQPAADGDMRLTAYDDWVTYNAQANPNRATVLTTLTAPGVAGYGAGGGPYHVPDDDGWEMVTPPSKAASQASHATRATDRTGETDASGLTGTHKASQSQSQSPYAHSQHSHSQHSHSSQRHPYAIEPPTATHAYGDIYDAYAPKARLPWRG